MESWSRKIRERVKGPDYLRGISQPRRDWTYSAAYCGQFPICNVDFTDEVKLYCLLNTRKDKKIYSGEQKCRLENTYPTEVLLSNSILCHAVTGADPACPFAPSERISTEGPHVKPKPSVSAVQLCHASSVPHVWPSAARHLRRLWQTSQGSGWGIEKCPSGSVFKLFKLKISWATFEKLKTSF